MRLFDEHAPARSARTRLALAASPGVLASMLALQPQIVQAQAFQGTATTSLGSISRGFLPGREDISVNDSQVIVNWVPFDTATSAAPINFLPTGFTANFNAGGGLPQGASFTVLNRIFGTDPTRAIALSGTVNSSAAGSVWFYAPSGLVIGSTAQFNVGSLLLTTNDPVGAAAGQPFITGGNQFRLQAATGSTAEVNITPGAAINASNALGDSYVIAVAPRVLMNGGITVDGSAALVAAEDASFTLNGGLFDITTNVATAATGIAIQTTGSITGPAGNSAQGIFHRIYMLAMPKNDTITMLISGGGNLGFDVAGAADVDGNAIVLSAGYNISGTTSGSGLQQVATPSVGVGTGVALTRVDQKTITSELTIRSTGNIEVVAQSGDLSLAGGVSAYGERVATVNASNNRLLTVGGDVLVDASAYNPVRAGTAGVATLTSGSADFRISGSATVRANGFGLAGVGAAPGGTGFGGQALIQVFNGGALEAASLTAEANGTGGFADGGRGGSGFGGFANLDLATGSTVTLNDSGSGNVILSALGIGDMGENGQLSGNANGGTARLTLNADTTLAIPGALIIDAGAQSGTESGGRGGGQNPTTNSGGGVIRGGSAQVIVQGGGNLSSGNLFITADAVGLSGAGGNDFRGGTARLEVNDSTGLTRVEAFGDTFISASAEGPSGVANINSKGGNATGGTMQIVTTGRPTVALNGAAVLLAASAIGGAGTAGGNGGTAVGGRAEVNFNSGGSLLLSGELNVSANATGGNGAIGGNATALDNGDNELPAVFLRYGTGGTAADSGIVAPGGISLSATATGGNGSSGAGGVARGGFTRAQLGSKSATAASLRLDGAAFGGAGTVGGNAQSGRAQVNINEATLNVGSLQLEADATGGDALSGSGGAGGNATVGEAFAFIQGAENGSGARIVADSMTIFARARGGAGGSSGSGTGGQGGNASGSNSGAVNLYLLATGGFSELIGGSTTVDNSSVGGTGGGSDNGAGGAGGNALGGGITNVGVSSGTITPVVNRSRADLGSTVTLNASAVGGEGGASKAGGASGRGGNATGGNQYLIARGAQVRAGITTVNVSATGGNGGNGSQADTGGGNALGGQGGILATPHATGGNPTDMAVSGGFTVNAFGIGGNSAAAPGSGRGGTAEVKLEKGTSNATNVGSLTLQNSAGLNADGFGGAARALGVAGGNGFGGTARVVSNLGTLNTKDISLSANGLGGSPGPMGEQSGNGTGGTVELLVNGGSASLASVFAAASGQFGTATGGTVRVAVQSLGGSLTMTGSPALLAEGLSGQGNGQAGLGSATGGIIDISTAATGTLTIANDPQGGLTISANASVTSGMQDNGSNAQGGQILISNAGTTSITNNSGQLTLEIGASAGNGGAILAGGTATGGILSIINTAGALNLSSSTNMLRIGTNAFGGASSVSPGNAVGGTSTITASGGAINFNGFTAFIDFLRGGAGASIPAGNATGRAINLNYSGSGRLQFNGGVDVFHSVDGRIAQSGSTSIIGSGTGALVVDGTLTLFNDILSNSGFNGVQVTGGTVTISSSAGASTTIAGSLDVYANANVIGSGGADTVTGGVINWSSGGSTTIGGRASLGVSASFSGGTGGTATAGSISVNADSGMLAFGQGLFATANASNNKVQSGPGLTAAGQIQIASTAGAQFKVTGEIALNANASGSDALDGAGGAATGGSIRISNAGTMQLDLIDDPISIRATATGGTGSNSSGGTGSGGVMLIDSTATGSLSILSTGGQSLELDAVGIGGAGAGSLGKGGDGVGGMVTIANAGNFTLPGGLNILVNATSGDGPATGNANGGTAMLSTSGGTTSINGNMTLNGNASVLPLAERGNGTGGTLTVDVNAGTLNVAGNVSLTAEGGGTIGRGGTLALDVDGSLLIGGSLSMAANVFTEVTVPTTQSRAGDIDVTVGAAGVLTIAGSFSANLVSLVGQPVFTMTARGGTFDMLSAGTVTIGGTGLFVDGGAQYISPGFQGGASMGGALVVNLTGGSFTSAGLRLAAGAGGGGNSQGVGGDATGGSARVLVASGASATINGELRLDGAAGAGSGATGGTAIGGTVQLSVAGTAAINLGPSLLNIGATAVGGNGTTANGGSATGGTVILESLGPSGSIIFTGAGASILTLSANGTGGNGSTFGGAGTGGNSRVVNDHILTLPGALSLRASGFGGFGGTTAGRGNGSGGGATLAYAGGTLDVGNGRLLLAADGDGNQAIAGTARISSTGGTLDVNGIIEVRAEGRGQALGSNIIRGGIAEILLADSSTLLSSNSVIVNASALANSGDSNPGGTVTGGTARFETRGTVTATNEVLVDAAAGFEGKGGASTAGSALLTVTGGSLQTANVSLLVQGYGGDSATGTAGLGKGGNAVVSLAGGAQVIISDQLLLDGMGTGGFGDVRGVGIGGMARLNSTGQGTALTVGTLDLYADGYGNPAAGGLAEIRFTPDAGGFAGSITSLGAVRLFAGSDLSSNGGDATGGMAQIDMIRGVLNIGGNLDLVASAIAQNGDTGSSATGGTAQVVIAGGQMTVTGEARLDATAIGGVGSGGIGGNADGGNASFAATAGTIATINGLTRLIATAVGGSGDTLGGSATAGNILVSANAAQVNANGITMLSASGTAGTSGTVAGNGTGGEIALMFNNGGGLAFGSTLDLDVQATGTLARAGNADLSSTGGTFSTVGDMQILANIISSGTSAGSSAFGGNVAITTAPTSTVSIGGSLSIRADVARFFTRPGAGITGGAVTWLAGGTTSIGKDNPGKGLSINTGVTGNSSNAGTATAGNIRLESLGSFTAGGLSASASAEAGYATSANGANGTAGDITILTNPGTSLTIAGGVRLEADGRGGTGDGNDGMGSGGIGGNGRGGKITLTSNGNTSFAIGDGALTISATGSGGTGANAATAAGGTGIGGTISVDVASNNSLIVTSTGSNDLVLDVRGDGGSSSNGVSGSGNGGTITVTSAGTFTLPNGLVLQAGASSGSGQAGGMAKSGTATLTVSGGQTSIGRDLSLNTAANVQASNGEGTAAGGEARVEVAAGLLNIARDLRWDGTATASNPTGGQFTLSAVAGTIAASGLILLDATAATSSQDSSGTIRGGSIAITTGTGGIISATNGLEAVTDATVNTSVLNQIVRAGSITVESAGTLSFEADLRLSTRARYQSPQSILSVPGAAFGGTATVTLTGGSLETRALTIDSNAIGAENGPGQGGNAEGGTAAVLINAGASATVNAEFRLTANATGGAGESGGAAIGGSSRFETSGTARINLDLGNFELAASAQGGEGTGVKGGAANGGMVTLASLGSTGDLVITSASTGEITLGTSGTGGNGLGLGGQGIGGTASISNGNILQLPGALIALASGAGGLGATLGDGVGGTAILSFDGGTLDASNGRLSLTADGIGNAAQGGTARIMSTGGTLLAGLVGVGAKADGVARGTNVVRGGLAQVLLAESSTLQINDHLTIDAGAVAGNGDGSTSGTVTGGTARFTARGNVQVTNEVTVNATGFVNGASGGAATGGGATLTVASGTFQAGFASVAAEALGGGNPNGTGSNGTGGTAQMDVLGGAAVTISNTLFMSARGWGGNGTTRGNGEGGTAQLTASGQGSALSANYIELQTDGSGRNGTGGRTEIRLTPDDNGDAGRITTRGSIGDIQLFARGIAQNGVGGTATGGTARVSNSGGVLTVGDDLELYAPASGTTGTLGDTATAGTAEVTVSTGQIAVTGEILLNVEATAGSGDSGKGGDATAGTAKLAVNTSSAAQPGSISAGNVRVLAEARAGASDRFGNGNGPVGGVALGERIDIVIGSSGSLTSGGIEISAARIGGAGGNGTVGSGGAATGGRILATVNGAINVGSAGLVIDAQTTGGAGNNGGNATGSQIGFDIGTGTLDVAGRISIAANTTGGAGQTAAGGNALGGEVRFLTAGGAVPGGMALFPTGAVGIETNARGGSGGGGGGTAQGGTILLGSTGNSGTLAIGTVTATANGVGGNGSANPGGAGGNANGGTIRIGMGSGTATGAIGTLNLASATLTASGSGGAAGAGSPAAHGNGRGGTIELLFTNANASVNMGLNLTANGNAGGSGGLPGISANGIGGSITIASTGQAGGPTVRLFSDGSVQATANGTGSGTSGSNGEPGVIRLFSAGGAEILLPSFRALADGSVDPTSTVRGGLVAQAGSAITVAGDIQFVSRGSLALNDGGTITAGGRLEVSAAGSLLSGFTAPAIGPRGVITAPIVVLNGTAGINLLTQTTGSQDVQIRGGPTATVTLQDVVSTGDILLSGGSIGFTSLRADRNGVIDAATAITNGTISAGGRLSLLSNGTINVGLIDAGMVRPVAAGPTDVFVRGNGVSITSVMAAGDIGLLSSGTLASGALTSGRDLVLLSGGNTTTGAILTPASGRVRFGSAGQASMITLAGGVPNYSQLFAASITPIAGDITVNGTLVAGLLEVATTGMFRARDGVTVTTGASIAARSLDLTNAASAGFINLTAATDVVLGSITADGGLMLATTGNINTGNLAVGGTLSLTASQIGGVGGALMTGTIRASDDIRLTAATTLNAGSLSAADSIVLAAGGSIITGNIDAGTVNPAQAASGVLFASSPGSIATGAINVSGSTILSGVLGVRTGNIAAPGGIVLLDTGGITTGALNTSASGFVYLASHELLPQISFDTAGNPQFAALLASTPQRLIGDISIDGAASTGRFIAAATGSFSAQAITAPTSLLIDVGGNVRIAGLINAGLTSINSSGNVALENSFVGTDDLIVVAGGTGSFGAITAAGEVSINTAQGLQLASVAAGDRMSLIAGGAITATGALSAAQASPQAGARGDIFVRGNGVSVTSVMAAGDIGLLSSGALASGALTSGRDLVLLSGGNTTTGAILTPASGRVRFGNIDQASLISVDTAGNPQFAALLASTPQRLIGDITITGAASTGRFIAAATGSLSAQAITAPTSLLIDVGGNVRIAGLINAGLTSINSSGNVALDSSFVGSDDLIVVAGGTGSFGAITAAGEVSINTAQGLQLASVAAGDRMSLIAGGAITATGALSAAQASPQAGARGDIFVRGNGVSVTSVMAAGDIGLLSSGALASGALTSGRDLVLLSGGTITTAAVATPTMGRIRFAGIDQASLISFAAGVPNYSPLFAASIVPTAGDITVRGALVTGLLEAATAGTFQARAGVTVSRGANIAARTVDLVDAASTGFINLNATSDLLLGNLTATGALTLGTTGNLTTGNLIVGGTLTLTARQAAGVGGALVTGTIRASDDIRLTAATTLTTGSLSAADSIFLNAGGAIILNGNIDAGTVNPAPAASGVLFVTTPGTISTGAINISGSATLSGVLGVTTGNIAAPGGIVLLDTGGITTGALSTSGSGFVYIASHELLPQITFDTAGNPQFAALLASTPQRLIGDITISGAASTGRFIAAATGRFGAQAITAPTSVLIDVGGAATLAGNISANRVAITSDDIIITPGRTIGGNGATDISLAANGQVAGALINNAVTTASIGGGDVTGTYSLSNAEFGTLRASNISVRLPTGTMTVGQLDLPSSVPGLGQGQNQGQSQTLPTSITLSSGGLLRVTGAVTMAQASAANTLALTSGSRIEVATNTGRIQLGSNAEAPLGTLTLTAGSVRVGSDTLLGQISGGTLTGTARNDAINAAAANPALAGPLIAGSIRINAAQDVLIQNSGDAATRAGFTAGSGGLIVTATGSQTALLDLVINGRVLGSGGTFLTNDATRTAVTVQPGVVRLASTAQVNGCAVVAGCTIPPPEPPPGPPPAVEQKVDAIVNNIPGLAAEAETTEQQQEEAEAAADKLPIVALQRLIDFSQMSADLETNDPATSGGNPALWLDPVPSGVRRPGGLK